MSYWRYLDNEPLQKGDYIYKTEIFRLWYIETHGKDLLGHYLHPLSLGGKLEVADVRNGFVYTEPVIGSAKFFKPVIPLVVAYQMRPRRPKRNEVEAAL